MTKNDLIVKQQLEIEELKVVNSERKEALENIVLQCVCIGGPLNDNCGGYTHKQMYDFQRIVDTAEEAL